MNDEKRRLHRFAADLPKIELHIHLEGSILPETLLALAQRHGVTLPAADAAGLRAWYGFTSFRHFLDVYLVISGLLRTVDDFALVVHDLGREMARQHIRYAEVTFTPFTHVWQDKGLQAADLIAGLDLGRRRAADEFGVDMAWVLDIPRNLSCRDGVYSGLGSDPTVDMALAWADRGVIALGLGGSEIGAPPEPFAPALQRIADITLRPGIKLRGLMEDAGLDLAKFRLQFGGWTEPVHLRPQHFSRNHRRHFPEARNLVRQVKRTSTHHKYCNACPIAFSAARWSRAISSAARACCP